MFLPCLAWQDERPLLTKPAANEGPVWQQNGPPEIPQNVRVNICRGKRSSNTLSSLLSTVPGCSIICTTRRSAGRSTDIMLTSRIIRPHSPIPAKFWEWLAEMLRHSAILGWTAENFEGDFWNLAGMFLHNSVHIVIHPNAKIADGFWRTVQTSVDDRLIPQLADERAGAGSGTRKKSRPGASSDFLSSVSQ